MAKKEDEKIPDYIAKHKKLYQHATTLVDTAGQVHSDAYGEAVKKHLMEGGEVKFDKLEDTKIQDLFVKTMSDMYINKAKAHFKVSKDLDDLEKDMLMQAYAGITSHELHRFVSKYGKKLNHKQFDALKGDLQGKIGERLYASATGHIRDEHIGGIVKHVGLEARVESAKLGLSEAKQLLSIYQQNGNLSDDILKQVLEPYQLKKKKEEKKK
ncbi:MAG: hypothetical protein AABX05_00225 [Nanoarchaeota archaeon]